MHYFYNVYGLTIASGQTILALPAAPDDSRTPDISLDFGPTPEWVQAAMRLPPRPCYTTPSPVPVANPNFRLTAFGDNEFFELAYGDGARFFTDSQTSRIWACWAPPLSQQDVLSYILGPVMGFVLRRRSITSLHASSVCLENRAIVLCGDSEAGKSTTAAALALRGLPVLCEDITALRETNGVFEVAPGYPRICLWPESTQSLLGATESLPPIAPGWEKGFLSLDGKRAAFESQSRTLGVVYVLAPRSSECAPRIEELSAQAALLELVKNTYMNWLLDRQQRATEFDALARLIAQVPVRRIVAHVDPAYIPALCELICADAKKLLGSPGTASAVALSNS